jgi:hypothetical protein
MACLNHDPATGAYRKLAPSEMCQAINRARVGLCLSQVEGGNYAATEYMLCGLPVVSTPSQGGRDYFLDPEVSRIVPPDTVHVARAVAELKRLDLPPRLVRLRALLKIKEQRQDFIRLIEALFAREGGHEPFADRFESVFTHKMMTFPGTPEAFLAGHGLLAEARPARPDGATPRARIRPGRGRLSGGRLDAGKPWRYLPGNVESRLGRERGTHSLGRIAATA